MTELQQHIDTAFIEWAKGYDFPPDMKAAFKTMWDFGSISTTNYFQEKINSGTNLPVLNEQLKLNLL